MIDEYDTINVKIIHMGGTFGMIKYKNYFKVQPNIVDRYLKESAILNNGKDLNKPFYSCNGKKVYYSVFENKIKDSSNLDIQDCSELSETIEKLYDEYDAFIIIHGTDTMSYTASALSFLIENLSKPIIFTGAMVPITETHTDAFNNLEGVFKSLTKYIKPDVYLYFSGKLMKGNRTTKIHSYGFDAYALKEDRQNNYLEQKEGKEPVRFFKNMSRDVTVFKIYPGLEIDKISSLFENYKGVVIESYGSGNVPNILIKTLEEHSENTIFVNISQCTYGCANSTYENGNALIERGIVICGHDMTTESAFTKLSFLLGNYSMDDVKKMLKKNIRGEMSE